MINGGFDPVAIMASVGDTIDVVVTGVRGDTVLTSWSLVRAGQPPIVVRTVPPPQKTDVPLNAVMAVVFSEPIAAQSLSSASVQLRRGGSSVGGTTEFLDSTGVTVGFVPAASLAPNAAYELVVTRAIRDLNGDSLPAVVTTSFTTGSGTTGQAWLVVVTPSQVFLPLGGQYQLSATAYDSAGNVITGQSVTWTSPQPGQVSVSAGGLVSAVAPGDVNVRAFVANQNGWSEVFAFRPGVDVFDVWDWTVDTAAAQGNPWCADTGSFVFTSDVGLRAQVGRCGGVDSVPRLDSIVALTFNLAGDQLSFYVPIGTYGGSGLYCHYMASLPSLRPDRLTGTAVCQNNTPQFTWHAVRMAPIGSVTVKAPNAGKVVVGGRMQVRAELRDTAGHRVFFRSVGWAVSQGTVASLTAQADSVIVTGLAPGSVTLTATTGAQSGRAGLTVQSPAALRVTTTTTGTAVDPGAHLVALDRGGLRSVRDSAPAIFSPLTSGNYQVQVLGAYVAVNCEVAAPNPRFVSVSAGETTTVNFGITCRSPGRLAFMAGDSLAALNGDGSGLSAYHIAGRRPAWSPDGARLAFGGTACGGMGGDDSEICVMNADGSGLVDLTNNPAHDDEPAWSPDGTRLVFRSMRDGQAELYVVNADGSGTTRLTTNAGVAWLALPAWSPDGAKIAFDCYVDAGNLDICVVNANGTAVTRLTADPGSDFAPTWKPDGSAIAFTTTRFDGRFEIAVMHSDGSSPTWLPVNAGLYAADPAWSPDGTRIALSLVAPCDPDLTAGCQDSYAIAIMRADGSNVLQVSASADNRWPAWRP